MGRRRCGQGCLRPRGPSSRHVSRSGCCISWRRAGCGTTLTSGCTRPGRSSTSSSCPTTWSAFPQNPSRPLYSAPLQDALRKDGACARLCKLSSHQPDAAPGPGVSLLHGAQAPPLPAALPLVPRHPPQVIQSWTVVGPLDAPGGAPDLLHELLPAPVLRTASDPHAVPLPVRADLSDRGA